MLVTRLCNFVNHRIIHIKNMSENIKETFPNTRNLLAKFNARRKNFDLCLDCVRSNLTVFSFRTSISPIHVAQHRRQRGSGLSDLSERQVSVRNTWWPASLDKTDRRASRVASNYSSTPVSVIQFLFDRRSAISILLYVSFFYEAIAIFLFSRKC